MRVAKRSLAFNRLYNNQYLNDYLKIFIQLLIKKGKKLQALKIIFKFFLFLKKEYQCKDFEKFFSSSFFKYEPKIAFVFRKVAAMVYSLPIFISSFRARILVIRQLFISAKERLEKTFFNCLIAEYKDFMLNYGKTIKKIEDYQLLAKKNKPFLRFLRKKRGSYNLRLKKYGIRTIRKHN